MQNVFKIIIAGGRDFSDYKMLQDKLKKLVVKKDSIEIVSGTANGADKLGESFALQKGYKIKRFPADWDRFGKSAGYRRNSEMADYADALVAFWDGKSRGTKHMIDLATDKGLAVRIVRY